MTRAAVILCSLLALAGCDEETVENLLEGKVEVFTIHSANIEGVTGVADGYHTWSDLQDSNPPGLDLPENVPFGIRDDLVNTVGSVEDTGCAKIPNTANMCFEEDDSTSCLPSELKELGLKTYKIDLDDLEAAIDVGFYPTAVQYLDEFGLNADLTIEDAECSAIE
ncbi:hypothetical protein [Photobacterium halotolerans]|uniref:Lipoprotein n=1 Tax=Photobacterium halotolerans TaxID=265726 RepID=A0A7X4XZV5_9GAMM|nr:hypothetical protein [Photobacterium halotolerans]NAW63653.1 hypothetical protein [Photobacterium halotolerans]NAW87525.1 hypothetical protein [Photobacterium halotolerans]NAX47156.1 hypothetical protein [Photobacterium halotolerans]